MEYRIIEATSAENLTALVNRFIAEGWTPTGGVAISEREYAAVGQSKVIKQTWAQAITLNARRIKATVNLGQ